MGGAKIPKINIWLRIMQAVLLILLLAFIILSFMDIAAAQDATVTTFSTLMLDLQARIGVFIGILAAIMVIIGGVVYAISGGDPSKMNLGKEIILSAIAGLVLFMFTAWFLGEDLSIDPGGVINKFFPPSK